MAQDHVVLDAFTELAPCYEETMDQELRAYWGIGYTEFVDRLIEAASVKNGEAVLDVATGTASIPLELANRPDVGGLLVGLDITPGMLAHGRLRIEALHASAIVNIVCASGMAVPFHGGSFDVAICGLGTHHMSVPGMLSEMKRVLKPGGRLVLADVGASAFWRTPWGYLLLRILMIHYGLSLRTARAQAEMDAFPNLRTADEWYTLLSQSGFCQIEITQSPARRPWFPCALTMSAAVAG